MFIAKLSDAVVQWLVPATTAAACIPPDPCDACANGVISCEGHQRYLRKYTLKVYNCAGQCRIAKKQLCYVAVLSPC